jgi:hypothetical protein
MDSDVPRDFRDSKTGFLPYIDQLNSRIDYSSYYPRFEPFAFGSSPVYEYPRRDVYLERFNENNNYRLVHNKQLRIYFLSTETH